MEADLWLRLLLSPGKYNLHRWYSPGTGRYTRTDPLGLIGGPNVYLYSLSNPVEWIDPMGLQIQGDAHIPTPEEMQRMKERSCARRAFYGNYGDMIEANWKRSDKYFHCKANCDATRCGDDGREQACELSDIRELFDLFFKGDPPAASAADQEANRFGREGAVERPNVSCQVVCSPFRPSGLPRKY